jgi:hypothetical protein
LSDDRSDDGKADKEDGDDCYVPDLEHGGILS